MHADTFDVSLTATALRYVECCPEPCAVVFSENGYIKRRRASREFEQMGVFIEWGAELSSSSLADSLF